MDNSPTRDDANPSRVRNRLMHAAGEVNAFLLVLAIGLAVLDFTCFCAFQVKDALPSAVRTRAEHSVLTYSLPAQRSAAVFARPGSFIGGQ